MTAPDPHARIMELQRKAGQQLDALKATLAEIDELRARRRPAKSAKRPRLRVIAGGRS